MRCIVAFLLLAGSCAGVSQTVSDPNFDHDFLYFGNGITAMQFDAQGRLWATEKQGRLVRFEDDGMGGLSGPDVLLDITSLVNSALERGIVGFVLDPDFASNGFLYFQYSTATDQRIARFTYDAMTDSVSAASELLLLTGLPNAAAFHKAGDIDFAPGDNQHLYIAFGDDGVPSRARDLNFYEGKFLRIDKATGQGVSSNPFWNGDADSIRSRVWLSGLRNPFRFAFHPSMPVADVLYISENGDATDRISWALRGSDGYWDNTGDGSPGCPGGCFLDPDDPNHRVMVAIEPSQIGIVIADSGPFAIGGNPTLYAGNWFPNEFSVRRYTLSGTDLDVATDIDGATPFVNQLVAVDLQFGPDNCLYTSSTGGDAAIDAGSIERICYIAGTPPVAMFSTSPSPAQGDAPLMVAFTDASTDSDGAIVDWDWDFGDGGSSDQQSPGYTYMNPGNFTATLTVTDDNGLMNSTSMPITVSASGNVTLDITVRDASGLPDAALAQAVRIALFQVDGVTPIAFSGGLGVDGNELETANDGTFNALLDLGFTGDGMAMVVNPSHAGGLSMARLGSSFPAGSPPAMIERTVYLSSTMINGRISATTGEYPIVDIGVTDENGSPYAIAGGRDGFDVITGVPHRVVPDAQGYFSVALRADDVPGTFSLDTPQDTNEDVYGPIVRDVSIDAAGATSIDLLVGVFAGGSGCDDLSGIPFAPPTNQVVETLFRTQCTACHTPTATNSGGLDLTTDAKHQLANFSSRFAPGIPLMEGGAIDRSYLFEKINCATPQTGDRMRPTNAMAPSEQALIRDWILDHVHVSSFED